MIDGYWTTFAKGWASAALLAGLVALPTQSSARITRIDVQSTVPAGAGFEQLDGIAHGAVDPNDPRNAIITDIDKAPTNADGLVEYNMDFRILRPTNGNGVLLYDVVNRGTPLSEIVFGPGFLGVTSIPRERGYISVWAGWQGDRKEVSGLMNIRVPVATDGAAPITGTIRTEYVVTAAAASLDLSSGAFTGANHRSYAAVSLDTSAASLTKRVREADSRMPIASGDWAFADCSTVPFPGTPDATKICLNGDFDPNYIYELLYEAKGPLVLGLGMAATRDLVAFLTHAAADDEGNANPVAGAVRSTLMHGTSQSGRFLRTFLDLGFNEDEDGKIVFQGMNPLIAPGRIPINVRFGQPGRAYGQHVDHLFPAYESPFTWGPVHDPIAGRTAGLLDRCSASNTCPKIIWTVSSTEYWQGRASLNTTDALGRHDVGMPGRVRMFLFSSTQHFALPFPPTFGICQQLSNPNVYIPQMRALLVALEDWVVNNRPPPASRYPLLRDSTLVASDQDAIGFPDIPGVTYSGLLNELTLLDLGADYSAADESGILDEPTVVVDGADYTVLVPKVDGDGNEIAGVRSTAIQAPLGTHMGWNLRAEGFAKDELCGLQGSFIPFATTQAERVASGDPRLSLEERYGDHAGYVAAVGQAVERLVTARLLLAADGERLVAEAEASDILN